MGRMRRRVKYTVSGTTLVLAMAVMLINTTSAAPIVQEGESFTLPSNQGKTFSDTGASGGQAKLIWSNGAATKTVTTPALSRISVRAKGDQCVGAPQMTIRINNAVVYSATVTATGWTEYGKDLSLPAGTQNVAVEFTNDAMISGCDRNLRFDKVTLTEAAVVAASTPQTGSLLEAEKLGLASSQGQVFGDSGASAGQGLLIWSNGTASGSITTPAAGRLTVRARGDQCAGAPQFEIKVDGVRVLVAAVPSTAWTDYGVNVPIAAGLHTVQVSFLNDAMVSGCDRNLRLDKISFGEPVGEAAPVPPPPPPSNTGQWNTYQGFNYMGWKRDSYAGTNAANSLNTLASTGANAVSINTIWYQSSGSSNTIYQDPTESASDAAMVTAIQRAKAKNLKVMIRPMVNATYSSGTWRGSFQPSNRAAWFSSYRSMMNRYAEMAQAQGADLLDIGSEFNSLQGESAQWRQVVAEARARYSGKITYSANWDTALNVSWFDAVDLIGVDAYFPLSSGATPSVDEIINRWSNYGEAWGPNTRIIGDMAGLSARFNKPIIFTEIGYRSGSNTLQAPWETGRAYAPAEQQRALEAAFRAWDNKPWFLGMFIWQWNADPGVSGPRGGVGDTDHTPQGKPAQQTVTDRYSAS